jgi:hypothetical protein
MVERKDPQLGRGVVLGDGHDIQASRTKQLTLVLLPTIPNENVPNSQTNPN